MVARQRRRRRRRGTFSAATWAAVAAVIFGAPCAAAGTLYADSAVEALPAATVTGLDGVLGVVEPVPAPPLLVPSGATPAPATPAPSGSQCSMPTAVEIYPEQDCNCSACVVHGSTWLRDKCCKGRGLWATILAFEKDPLWLPRLSEFTACTGARIVITYNPTSEDGMENALRQDVGVRYKMADGAMMQKEGAGIYDGYVVQVPWLPAIKESLENLSPWIAQSDSLNWLDINSMSRQMASFNNTVRALPLDVDYIAIGWRQDVFEAHGKEPPETMEELAELSEYFNGKDHNADGEPDWGFCLTPQVNYLMAFVAPHLQMTHRACRRMSGKVVCNGAHTGQNAFFNISTFDPLVNAGFRRGVELFRRVLLSSNCPEQSMPEGSTPWAIGRCDRKVAFRTGKCAGVISLPGTMTQMLTPWNKGGINAPQPRYDLTRKNVVWEPKTKDGAYWGRRSRFPGAFEVFDPATNQLRKCDRELCPKAIPHPRTGELVNYAPFFSEGGESYAIRGGSSSSKKELLWELFSWLGTLPSTLLPLSGFYRESQLTGPEAGKELLLAGWPELMVTDMFEVLRFNFMNPETGNASSGFRLGNQVMDLFVLGFSEYMADLNRIMFTDFLLSPEQLRGPGANGSTFPDEHYQEAASKLVKAYNSRTDTYGRLNQLLRWRESLNIPFMGTEEICRELRSLVQDSQCHYFDEREWAHFVLLPVGSVAAIAVLLLLCAGVNRVRKDLNKKRQLEMERQKRYGDTVESAEAELCQLGFPMTLTQAHTFVRMGRLKKYEELRDRGELVFLDSPQRASDFKRGPRYIVFLSHQWLGWDCPDPSGVHYNTMRCAVNGLLGLSISSLGLTLDSDSGPSGIVTDQNLYVWVDYTSIAQDHSPTQILAVSSLPIYSSFADVFIVVAPPALHAESGRACNIDTYNSRGWCRAEMLSKICGTGLRQMFIISTTDGVLEPVTEAQLGRLDLKVFHGDFTCCHLMHDNTACDKLNLIRPVLGLYSLILRQRHLPIARTMLEYIEGSKEDFFPETFQFLKQPGSTEARELFGPLVTLMEKKVYGSGESEQGVLALRSGDSEQGVLALRSTESPSEEDDTSSSVSESMTSPLSATRAPNQNFSQERFTSHR